jgi:hypothetical protein
MYSWRWMLIPYRGPRRPAAETKWTTGEKVGVAVTVAVVAVVAAPAAPVIACTCPELTLAMAAGLLGAAGRASQGSG